MKFLLISVCLILNSICQEQCLKFKHVWKPKAIENTLREENNPDKLRDKNGKNILHFAATKDKNGAIISYILTTYPMLLDTTDNDGHTPLHFAAFHGNYHGVELLLEAGANANAANINGKTAAHKAVQLGNFTTECLQHLKVIITSLFNHKAKLNLQDYKGNTFLHDAAARGNTTFYLELYKMDIINHGARNQDKYTASQLAKIAHSPILRDRYFKNILINQSTQLQCDKG